MADTTKATRELPKYFTRLAHKKNNGDFHDIFLTKFQVEMCGAGTIYVIKVRGTTKDEQSNYWGWVDLESRVLCLIFPEFFLLEMCFPDGIQHDIDRGDGLPVNLVVELVDTLENVEKRSGDDD